MIGVCRVLATFRAIERDSLNHSHASSGKVEQGESQGDDTSSGVNLPRLSNFMRLNELKALN